MISAANPYQLYQQTKVETSSPLHLVVMLYDGAIRFANQAIQAMNQKDITKTNESLKRVQDIVDELMVSLNPEAGEIAQNLCQLYEYMNYRLIQANISKNSAELEDVVKILSVLRSGWAELEKQAPKAVGD